MAATLLNLRNRVLINLNDLQDAITGTGDRYKNLNLNSTINDVIHHYERLLNSFYQGYLSTDISINLLSGVTSYALGSGFRSPIYEVRRTVNDVNFYLNPVLTYNAILTNINVSNNQWTPSYRLEGNNIIFSYPPSDAEAAGVIVKHQKKLVNLAIDSSPLDDQLFDAEDCIVLKSSIRALRAKDISGALKNISGWDKELQESEKAFFMQAGNRFVKPDRPIPISYDYDTLYY